MKIKEVEKEVGISAHSIRFYEDMGLIQIQRRKDSTYINAKIIMYRSDHIRMYKFDINLI